MQLTEEEKLKLKIFKILLRKKIHQAWRMGVKVSKKVGLIIGLTLVSLCGKAQNTSSFKEILALASEGQFSTTELMTSLQNSTSNDSVARGLVQDEINAQIRRLAEDFLYARSDSLSLSIDRLKNPRTRTREIRRNFKDAVGVSQISSHCLATQCAADYRALRAMGLEGIIPQDLRQSSALCRSYIKSADIKPFAYEVANTDKAINDFIKEHKLSGGALIFYPRGGGNYHAVSLDMPEGEFEYNDSIDKILTSSANREHKNVPVSTAGFRKKAPGKKAVIVDKLNFFIALLEKHLEGKTLAEQTAFLYKGGSDEFLQHLHKTTGITKKQLVASIEKTISSSFIDVPNDNRSTASLYLLALVPMAYNRRSNKTIQALEIVENELETFTTLDDKCEYLDKNLSKALVAMSKDEQKQFLDSLIVSSERNHAEIEPNTAVFATYRFWKLFDEASRNGKDDTWHEVSNSKQKRSSAKTKITKPAKIAKQIG